MFQFDYFVFKVCTDNSRIFSFSLIHLVMSTIWISFTLLYIALRIPLLAATAVVVEKMGRFFNILSYQANDPNHTPPPYFQEMLLICFMLVLFVYAVKLLEYLIFKLKV